MFWCADHSTNIVPALVHQNVKEKWGNIMSLRNASCRRVLLKIPGGEQHLLLRSLTQVSQVCLRGEDIRTDPFSISIVVGKFPIIDESLRSIRELSELYRGSVKRSLVDKNAGKVDSMRHRDALIAFDLRQLGLSYQNVARAICGKKFCKNEWNNPNRALKNRTIRSFKKGQRMVSGGYRKLIN